MHKTISLFNTLARLPKPELSSRGLGKVACCFLILAQRGTSVLQVRLKLVAAGWYSRNLR